jgi:hypothetical protein
MNRSTLLTTFALTVASALGLCLPACAQNTGPSSETSLHVLIASRGVITEDDLASTPHKPQAAPSAPVAEDAAVAETSEPTKDAKPKAGSTAVSPACSDLAQLQLANEFLTRRMKRLSALLEAAKTDLRREIYSNARSRVEAELGANQEEIDYILHDSETKCSTTPSDAEPSSASPSTAEPEAQLQ